MSLQVWLPLNGDLHNQGIKNIAIANNGATVNENGKIGKCYQFGADASQYIDIAKEAMTSCATEASVCFWLKILTWNTGYATYFQAGPAGISWQHYTFGLLRNASNSTCCFTISNGTTASNASYSTPDFDLNKWYHISLIYKTGHCLIYINGQLHRDYTTSIVPDFANITRITVGMGNNRAGYQSNCLMNDLRIYNHALSEKQIKEISKGLILHYPLNRQCWGQENLLLDSNIEKSGESNVAQWFRWNLNNLILTTNIDYTLSFDAKMSNSDVFYISFANNDSTQEVLAQGVSVTTKYKRYIFTKQTSKTNINSIVVSNYKGYGRGNNNNTTGTLYIKNIKLEIGNKATPWCPNVADDIYTTLGLNNNIQYDISGYQNNGIKWNYDTLGEIIQVSDTLKYNVSTYINSENNTTNTASGTRYIYGNCVLSAPEYLTVTFWCKPIAGYGGGTGQGQFSLTNNVIGNSAGQDYDTAPMNHRDNCIDMCTSSGVHKTMNIIFTANEWHHYAIVYDGRYGRVYKDGIATGQTLDMGSILPLKNMKGVVIGFSRAGGVWRSNKSYYSDFRLYVTALSAEDILSLYNNEAEIDQSGVIHGQMR